MNIEEIMKPYFDKKEEIENKNKINNNYLEEKRIIELRLERLRDNKEEEIEEYVKNAVSDRPDFYAGYGAMIRKDLEQAYLSKEQKLEAQIKELDEKMKNNSNEVARYYRVDVRELVDVKHDLRKSLIAAKKELEIKLQEATLRFDAVMYKLSTFKYEYDENHNVLNGNEYRELFELSNSLIEVKYNLQRDLKQVDEYLTLTELTEEEVKTVMMSMSDLEKEEYNRRKNIIQNIEEIVSPIEIDDNNDIKEQEPTTETKEKMETKKDEIILEEPVVEIAPVETSKDIYEQAKETMDAQGELEHNYSAFIDEISEDVLRCVKKLRTIKVEDGKVVQSKSGREYKVEGNLSEEIELANGLYLNRHDIEKAVRNYKRQNKGRTFTVKGIDLALNVTKQSVKKVKEALRKFSLQELLREKKISIFDVKRVYGKDNTEKYVDYDSDVEYNAEDYVKYSDVREAFKELFVEKTPTWLERLTSKFRRPELEDLDQVPYEDYEEIEEVQDAKIEQIEDQMSWDAEEPEYEVVRAKTR